MFATAINWDFLIWKRVQKTRGIVSARRRDCQAGASLLRVTDFLQLRIAPLACCLEDQVQLVLPDSERHLDPALHAQFDIIEGDFEARYGSDVQTSLTDPALLLQGSGSSLLQGSSSSRRCAEYRPCGRDYRQAKPGDPCRSFLRILPTAEPCRAVSYSHKWPDLDLIRSAWLFRRLRFSEPSLIFPGFGDLAERRALVGWGGRLAPKGAAVAGFGQWRRCRDYRTRDCPGAEFCGGCRRARS